MRKIPVSNELAIFLKENKNEINKRWAEFISDNLFSAKAKEDIFPNVPLFFFLFFESSSGAVNFEKELTVLDSDFSGLVRSFYFYKSLLQELIWEKYPDLKKAYYLVRRTEDLFKSGLDNIFNYYHEKKEKASPNGLKLSFITNLSHELRTLLTSLLGYSDLIKNESLGALPEYYKDVALNINIRCRLLVLILNDYLCFEDYSQSFTKTTFADN